MKERTIRSSEAKALFPELADKDITVNGYGSYILQEWEQGNWLVRQVVRRHFSYATNTPTDAVLVTRKYASSPAAQDALFILDCMAGTTCPGCGSMVRPQDDVCWCGRKKKGG